MITSSPSEVPPAVDDPLRRAVGPSAGEAAKEMSMKVRCIRDRDNAWVRAGSVHEVERKDSYGWVMLVGGPCWFPMAWFEPVTDEAEAPAEQTKVDPYEAHRERLKKTQGLHECDMRVMTASEQPGATARLHAGLESEKVRERVKTFPHPARNPR